jgi:hypothetical protein
MWTEFWDMHSGGDLKEKWSQIFIEAPENEAVIIFQNRFGHNPHRVTCTCCGSDYAVEEYYSLERATAFHRGCGYDEEGNTIEQPSTDTWRTYKTLDEFLKQDNILVVREEEIQDWEREGTLRVQGYVWLD